MSRAKSQRKSVTEARAIGRRKAMTAKIGTVRNRNGVRTVRGPRKPAPFVPNEKGFRYERGNDSQPHKVRR